jgi:hypothetical protein
MIRNTIRIALGNKARERGSDAVRRQLKARPALTELEGRALLSGVTLHSSPDSGPTPSQEVSMMEPTHKGANATAHAGGADDARFTPALTKGGKELHGSHKSTHHGRRQTRESTGQILFDGFNGTGGVPKNWLQFIGANGDVKEMPNDLTMTDSKGTSVGIVSTLTSSVFSPQGVQTTIKAVIKGLSVNPKRIGNAIVGLTGVPNANGPTGELAAGIDATGVVFVVVQQQKPAIGQTILPIGTVAGYKGGTITLTLTINPTGVTVSAGSFNSHQILFTKLSNFSLQAAFGNGAIPALVAASQQGQQNGAASFESITVNTNVARRR